MNEDGTRIKAIDPNGLVTEVTTTKALFESFWIKEQGFKYAEKEAEECNPTPAKK